jgi:plasmid stabilization system protein ParE
MTTEVVLSYILHLAQNGPAKDEAEDLLDELDNIASRLECGQSVTPREQRRYERFKSWYYREK